VCADYHPKAAPTLARVCPPPAFVERHVRTERGTAPPDSQTATGNDCHAAMTAKRLQRERWTVREGLHVVDD